MNRVLIIGILMLFSAPGAMAQTQVMKMVCSIDVEAKCGKVQPGENRIRACVADHLKDFSEPCKVIIAKSAKRWDECALDLKRSCDDVQTIRKLRRCVKANLATFSKPCRDAMAQNISGRY